jgi:hypothetical protein
MRTGNVPSHTTEGAEAGRDVAMAWTLPVGTLTASDYGHIGGHDHTLQLIR